MKRILYFLYFIKTTNYNELKASFKEINKREKLSYRTIITDIIISSFKYKASFKDYFILGFYNMRHDERDNYLTTGLSYEFNRKMNEKSLLYKFRDKKEFNDTFNEFINREYLFTNNSTKKDFLKWVSNKDYIIAKPNEGVSGQGIEKINTKKYRTMEELYSYLKSNELNLIEEVIVQHNEMNKMNPSSVNTLRIITVCHKEGVDIIAAVLRIGVGNHIDNFSAGGIAAPIEIETGIVMGNAVTKDSTLSYESHPTTDCKIKGFKIPHWNSVIKKVKEAAEVIPEVRTIGWDIAITAEGPEFIEGNDNWNKDSFQLPYRKGRNHVIEQYK